MLDTNVLVAAFHPAGEPGRQEYAQSLLYEEDHPLLVPSVVIVEGWGMLVGKLRSWTAGSELLAWLNQPGAVTIVPPHQSDIQSTEVLVQTLHIDCVDAMLAELATNISQYCGLTPSLPIATFDTNDFFKMT